MKVHDLLFVAILSLGVAVHTQLVKGQPRPGCPTRCGNVIIEYPFGISEGCYYPGDRDAFELTCKDEKLRFFAGHEVISIFHSGQLRIMFPVAYSCYDVNGNFEGNSLPILATRRFTLSSNNSYIGVGCSTYALLRHHGKQRNYTFGCISLCDVVPPDGECSGEGCCQMPVPRKALEFKLYPRSIDNQTSVHSFNPCAFAFLVENGKFNFSASKDLKDLRNVKEFPVLLDWSIGEQTCDQVGKKELVRWDQHMY
ncbi:unnamed protein product [Arabis nemorensis]|uniref:Wall-associated receptor kinase galacturonan-binding domain-containing protein n=1 Tax=Arabis nemorensis TaxID=586526 RepID=A0A565B7A2_9BRAS|nr:unnamed protein product [Arabis nemorensis]